MALRVSERFRIFQRDNFTCQYCGQRAPNVVLHVDHIQPRAAGGEDRSSNLLTACQDCNLGKSDSSLGYSVATHSMFLIVWRRFGPFSGGEEKFIREAIMSALVLADHSRTSILEMAETMPTLRSFVIWMANEDEMFEFDPDKGEDFGNYNYPDPLDDGNLLFVPSTEVLQ